jgi:hypothetical protein
VLALGLVDCRQVAGIRDRPSAQAACSSCLSASCGAAERTCRGLSSCASRLDCSLGCDGNDDACVESCETVTERDAASLSAIGGIGACRASACGDACSLDCGGLNAIAPPESAGTCAACMATQCCSLEQACAANADCVAALECARGVTTTDGVQTCEDVKYPGGADAVAKLLQCVNGICLDECAVGQDWSCVGHVSWPVPTAATITGNLTVVDATAQSVVLPNLTVSACFTETPGCNPPIAGPVTTDANGVAAITLPMDTQEGRRGFIGYFLVTDTTSHADPVDAYLPTLVFPGAPITQDGAARRVLATTLRETNTIANSVHLAVDASRPSLVVTATDCAGSPAPGITFAVDDADSETLTVYTSFGIPSLALTETDQTGTAIIGDLPHAGLVRVTATRADTGAVVADQQALAVVGQLTIIVLEPQQ